MPGEKNYVTKWDDKTHRFMDQNVLKGLRKNSKRDKLLRRMLAHPCKAGRRRMKHGDHRRTRGG